MVSSYILLSLVSLALPLLVASFVPHHRQQQPHHLDSRLRQGGESNNHAALTAKSKKDDSKDLESDGNNVAASPSFVRNPSNGQILHDPDGNPLTIDRMLGTRPLRRDVLTRPGPRGRQLVYMSGETVISTLNQIFGYNGWNLQVLETQQVLQEQDAESNNGLWRVVYTAHVRITLTTNDGGTVTMKEDFGTGESQDRNVGAAIQMALKASITDAVKRAARHFGDKLGNCLYDPNFDINKAPKTLREALDEYDKGAP